MKQKLAGLAVGATLAAAAAFIATHEGYKPETYLDPVGIPTVCFGHTGPDVVPGKTYAREQCVKLLESDLHIARDAVRRCIRTPLTEGQEIALTSFAFNVGGANLCRSQLARKANAGRSYLDWCRELERWVYAKGRVLPGLVKRRKHERELCEQ